MPNTLHKEILTEEQTALLPLIKRFSKDFSLVGGTAVALYIGHRESIDFDLFSLKAFNNLSIRRTILKNARIDRAVVDKAGEYTLFIDDVKLTFYHYPFKITFPRKLGDIIKLPDLLTLAAMKAYTLGRRAKWKDYVDLYFVMERHHQLRKIAERAKMIFRNEFNEKLFRSQLVYFEDVDCSEKIIFKKGFEVGDKEIKKRLTELSLN